MKIIITEEQYKKLKKSNIKDFLFSLWDKQKKEGEEPSIDDFIFSMFGKNKNDKYVTEEIRSIWNEYNGGYKNIIQRLKDEILHDELNITGMFNLNMNIFINDIIDYDRNYVEIRYSIINGVVDYEDVNEMGEVELIPGMDISDVYSNLEYYTHDFDTFLSDSVYDYLNNKLNIPNKYGIIIACEQV